MSGISIVCKKYAEAKEEKYSEKEKYHKDQNQEKKDERGIILEIESHQLFMNTEQFFNSVKESIGKYFDSIQKEP
jgi:hypothetical protein